jgi:hypothetical protein
MRRVADRPSQWESGPSRGWAGLVAIRSARMTPLSARSADVDAAGRQPDRVHALSVPPGTGERREPIDEYTSIFQTMRKRIADISLLPN